MGLRPRVSETRAYTLRHSPKKIVRPERLARSRAGEARRFLRPPGLLFHTRPQREKVAAAGLAPAQARGPTGFEAVVFTDFTTLRKESGAGGRSCTRTVNALDVVPLLLGYTGMEKLEHPQGRAPCSLPYQGSPSLSTGWMREKKSGRSGRTCTFVTREGVAFTARCVCCSATLR